MSARECFCGCGKRHGLQLHHVVTQQKIRREARGEPGRDLILCADRRNLVPVGRACHAKHHSRQEPYELRRLPDSVFEFARELLGAGPAYEYLRRSYAGEDARLDALIKEDD
jgi:hypothetical protein